MITFEILESPDFDSIGIHKFEINYLAIGPRKKNLLIVYDKQIINGYIELRLKEENKLIINGLSPYFIRGIKYQGSKNLKKGEEVIIIPSVKDEEAKQLFPEGWKAVKPYLRKVPDPSN